MNLRIGCVVVGFLLLILPVGAQTSGNGPASAQVPPLIQFSSIATDEGGNTLSGAVNLTFALYAAQQGGQPLWTETQNNVPLDATGHYSVQLGITKPNGVPTPLFSSGEARWLGVRIAEQAEQPRVLLLSVPYALKSGDAATIGGLPPSAFVLAAPPTSTDGPTSTSGYATTPADGPPAGSVTGSGTADYVPLWTSTSNIGNSVLFQSGTGSKAKVGINTITPATTLDVKGAATIRGLFSLPAAGTATATKGFDSQAEKLTASAFDKGTGTAVTQNFQWQAEPVDNNTSTASGSLNLLFGQGTNKLAETGLNIASNGQISFATGQTFPGTGDGTITGVTTATGSGLIGGGTSGTLDLSLTNACATNQGLQWNGTSWTCTAVGTITGVTAGTDLSGGGTSGNVTLSLNTSATNALYARLAAANTFTATQNVNGSLIANSNGSLGLLGESNTTSGTAAGVYGTASSSSGYGVEGTSPNIGVYGLGTTTAASGVLGEATTTGVAGLGDASTGPTQGVYGVVGSPAGVGVIGSNLATTGGAWGVVGTTLSAQGYGVEGQGPNVGVYGQAGQVSDTGYRGGAGLWGDAGIGSPSFSGVQGTADDTAAGSFFNNSQESGTIYAQNNTTAPGAVAFAALLNSLGYAYALIGDAVCGSGFMAIQLGQDGGMSACDNYTLMGGNGGNDTYLNANAGGGVHVRVGNAPELNVTTGKVDVIGTLSKGGGSFKIDHPLDPANKYLYHSFVESPDMMNIYNGNVTTDASGAATVELPEWFETLNRDFRYQLTVIGQFAQAIVASEISGNQFSIRTDKPNVKVSWQVTGIRQDAFANANRIQVEVEKAPADRGHYLYPELVGAPKTEGIGYMAPAPGSEQIVHHQRPALRRGNASPLQQRTPPILPIRPRPVPPNVPPLSHATAQASKLEVNQK
jgi:trimeric autotransporter adhesin